MHDWTELAVRGNRIAPPSEESARTSARAVVEVFIGDRSTATKLSTNRCNAETVRNDRDAVYRRPRIPSEVAGRV